MGDWNPRDLVASRLNWCGTAQKEARTQKEDRNKNKTRGDKEGQGQERRGKLESWEARRLILFEGRNKTVLLDIYPSVRLTLMVSRVSGMNGGSRQWNGAEREWNCKRNLRRWGRLLSFWTAIDVSVARNDEGRSPILMSLPNQTLDRTGFNRARGNVPRNIFFLLCFVRSLLAIWRTKSLPKRPLLVQFLLFCCFAFFSFTSHFPK